MASFVYTWENLTYSVDRVEGVFWKPKKSQRLIIDNVSGNAFSGSLIAIMGESGCGKTTFLKLISAQMKGGGILKMNGRVITGAILRHNSIYLQQNDVFFENLTLDEHIRFMAAMSLKKHSEQRNMEASTLLKNLSLEKSKHVKIKHLSGGEKRKLSLASNLLLDPFILFCDEPTSGLDSFNAISMVKTLERLTETGKLIFMTVHQPSSQIFDLFSNIILLSSNGKIIFQGTTDNAKSFFETQQIICPHSYNPSDFYIKNLSIKSEIDEKRINSMLQYYKEHYEVKINFSEAEYDGIQLKYRENKKSFFFEINWLIWRVFILLGRNIREYYSGLLVNMIAAVIIGIIYSKVTLTDASSVQNIQGVLLLVVSELIFHQLCQNLYTFPQEIDVFVQEKALYTSLPYYLSKIVSLIPFALIHSGGFLLIYFIFLPFLTKIDLFLEMMLILFVTCLSGSSLGLCLSAIFSSLESINLFLVPFQLVCLVLSGLWFIGLILIKLEIVRETVAQHALKMAQRY
ncbi:hypothetical protein GWI33_004036 [Rhynchophorus ferrugineus]|uniref:ABC transporter domain-containing protein n=1 Tax=Rhynchophorus ferrugineus TaxID=354439 RepID=A0A834IJA9_RHYFE|nr:hypothetical protein GWI33_004036 [Rhynchophorus ferrugineus]